MNWDLAVDVVCAGSGAAGLATAVFAVDFGGDAFVAAAPVGMSMTADDHLHAWLGAGVSDTETTAYLVELSSDLGPLARRMPEVDVPISVVHEPPTGSGHAVAPFVGARLREWAARCLASPYGFVHTRVSEWPTTALHTVNGETIEVAEVGSMLPDPDNVGASVLGWLSAQARDRHIEVVPDCALQRIVFEEGEAVGAVFTTPKGSVAVRARYGVMISMDRPQSGGLTPRAWSAVGDSTVRVCLVSRFASRFGRVELLTHEQVARDALATCQPPPEHLRTSLHGTQAHSPTWRCGNVDGYPTPGE